MFNEPHNIAQNCAEGSLKLEYPVAPLDHHESTSSAATAKQRLENAIACLQLLETRQFPPEYLASFALNEIFMAAAGCANLPAVAPEASQAAGRMLRDCCPIVDASVNKEISSEHLYFHMGTAAGLLTLNDDPFHADRLAYAGIIAAELGAIHHRRCLRERDFPLFRDARMRRAWAAPRDPDGTDQ